jgi:RNA polymerase sigma-70 factor (sigma-E family)
MSDVRAKGGVMTPSPETPGFEDFVEARGASLLRSAWLLTGDRQKAEDLVQTALAKAWAHWSSIGREGTGSHSAYVHRIMVTTYAAWWRRKWNAEQPYGDLPEPGQPRDEVLDLRRDLLTALSALPRGQRAVIVLRYFDDLTEAQTAHVLDCSIGTVKSQTARALAVLRRSPLLSDGEASDA